MNKVKKQTQKTKKRSYFTVGPSQVYPTVDKHLRTAIREQIPSLSHRGKEFQAMYQRTEELLKELLGIPDDYAVFFLGSSIEAMERIIQNTVEKTSFHFIDGAFSQKAAAIAEELQKTVIRHEAPRDSSFDLKKVTIPKNAELIFITENDTSTGLIFLHEYVYELKKQYPEKLIAVDLVSSAPYSPLDFSQVDLAFFSGQKGFGIPAGLSVLIVSPAALKKAEALKAKGINIGTYHNFPTLQKNREKWMTPETPNVLAIYLLQNVIEDMLKQGIEKIRKETDNKAKILYRFFEENKHFSPFIKDQKFRSPTTLVIEVVGGSKEVRERLAKVGIIVGSGYGENKDLHIRVANFPTHTMAQIKTLMKLLSS